MLAEELVPVFLLLLPARIREEAFEPGCLPMDPGGVVPRSLELGSFGVAADGDLPVAGGVRGFEAEVLPLLEVASRVGVADMVDKVREGVQS
ncbi:hypothetical protein AB0F25_13635 [Streptomyces wedmorensis]|uniref:hypothetical protein n=1 Tax=Streptomyces wedmorensis TaxID=43759 RepID=UPI003424D322